LYREIAAIAKWHFPHTLTAEEAAEEAAEANEAPPDVPGYNKALVGEFFGALKVNREKWVVREEMYC
jgi:hypothetical protein